MFTKRTSPVTPGSNRLITAANILNGEKQIYQRGQRKRLLDAIVDSCALPFLFRTYVSGGSIVDGGICDNLPADELVNSSNEYGEVIGFSYTRQATPQPPNNFLEYAKAILNSAIDNSVYRAIERIGEGRVCRLPTAIESYQFKRAITDGIYGDHYQRQKLEADKWLHTLISEWRQPVSDQVILSPSGEPINVREMMDRIVRVYDDLYDYKHVKEITSSLIVTSYCLLPEADPRSNLPDEVCQEVTIEPTAPLNV